MTDSVLDRPSANDIESILAVGLQDPTEAIHAVRDNAEAIFTWDYEKGARPALNKLYEKAKHSQWNGETDLDWSIDVDIDKGLDALLVPDAMGFVKYVKDDPSLPLHKLNDAEWRDLAKESLIWRMSQFMHGEQGALICTAKIVETVPWIDAKYYASTQVMDEARHVEVFAKYLDTKLDGFYPINAHLKMLLDDIISDSRWDMTYLGMQIMVEGLALAAFGVMHAITDEPLLKKLLRYVMSDEARHVAFGVLSLQEYYQELTDVEMFERQQFAFEAAVRMRDRFLAQEIWERKGFDTSAIAKAMLEVDRSQDLFTQLLFAKIVPNCSKLGLLDRNDGWLRQKFTDINVIQFEGEIDTGDDYETYALGEDLPAVG